MPLSKEEQEQLEALQKKAEEPEPAQGSSGPSLVVNTTVDLNDENQVRRAVKAGLLPASYLEDDEEGGDEDGGDEEADKDAGPKRKLGSRYA